jgi:hypothetical protein
LSCIRNAFSYDIAESNLGETRIILKDLGSGLIHTMGSCQIPLCPACELLPWFPGLALFLVHSSGSGMEEFASLHELKGN